MVGAVIETRTGTQSEVSRTAATWLADALRSRLGSAGRAVLAIPGGRSVVRTLAYLAREALDWNRIELFFADERHLPPGNTDRNDVAVESSFLAPLLADGLDPAQIHRAPFRDGDPERAAREYRSELDRFGTVHVMLLGAGEDGHIASLFPGRSHGTDAVHVVRDSPKPPPIRLTMSPGVISAVDHCCLLFFGSAKTGAYRAFEDPHVTTLLCPAKLCRECTSLFVGVDTEARGTTGANH